jgi:hypothetical protein
MARVEPADRLTLDRRLAGAGATVAAIDRRSRRVVGVRDGVVVDLPPDEGTPAPVEVLEVVPVPRGPALRALGLLGAAAACALVVLLHSGPAPPAAHATPPAAPPAVTVSVPAVRHTHPVAGPRRHHRRHRPAHVPAPPVSRHRAPSPPPRSSPGVAEPAV